MFNIAVVLSHAVVLLTAISYYFFRVRINYDIIPTVQEIGNSLAASHTIDHPVRKFNFVTIDSKTALLNFYEYTVKTKSIEKLERNKWPVNQVDEGLSYAKILKNINAYYYNLDKQMFKLVPTQIPIVDTENRFITYDGQRRLPIFLNTHQQSINDITFRPYIQFDNDALKLIGNTNKFCNRKGENTPIDMHMYKHFLNTADSLKNFRFSNAATLSESSSPLKLHHPYIYFDCSDVNIPKVKRCEFNHIFSIDELICRPDKNIKITESGGGDGVSGGRRIIVSGEEDKEKILNGGKIKTQRNLQQRKLFTSNMGKNVTFAENGDIQVVLKYEDKPLNREHSLYGLIEYSSTAKFKQQFKCKITETKYIYNFDNKIEHTFSLPNEYFDTTTKKCFDIHPRFMNDFSLGPIHPSVYLSMTYGFYGYFSDKNESLIKQIIPKELIVFDNSSSSSSSAVATIDNKISIHLLASATQSKNYYRYIDAKRPDGLDGGYKLIQTNNNLIIYKNKIYKMKETLKTGDSVVETIKNAFDFIDFKKLPINPFPRVIWSDDGLKCATVISNTVIDLTILLAGGKLLPVNKQFNGIYKSLIDDFKFIPSWIEMQKRLHNIKNLRNIYYFDMFDLYEDLDKNKFEVVDKSIIFEPDSLLDQLKQTNF